MSCSSSTVQLQLQRFNTCELFRTHMAQSTLGLWVQTPSQRTRHNSLRTNVGAAVYQCLPGPPPAFPSFSLDAGVQQLNFVWETGHHELVDAKSLVCAEGNDK